MVKKIKRHSENSDNPLGIILRQSRIRNFYYGVKRFWKYLGAGLITGAADDDIAAITVYSIAGARLGFSSLWTALFTFPLMSAVQEMAARIGMTTKMGLAGVLKSHYSPWLLFLVVLLMVSSNIFNIGADLSGMSAATNLLIPQISARIFDLIFVLILVCLMIYLDFKKIVRYFKWLALTLLLYVAAALFISHNWTEIWKNVIFPNLEFNKETISIIIAVFGTTLAPYIYFWQTTEEAIEEKKLGHNHNLKNDEKFKKETSHMRKDVIFGMFFSNLIMFFVMILAATLFFNQMVTIKTIDELSRLLGPLVGDFGQLVFTLGVVGTGFLVIPILSAGSAYILVESFGWKGGLDHKFGRAKEFYLIIILSTGLALLMNYFGFNPVRLLFYTAFIHGLISPILILTILLIANNKKIMGSYSNGLVSNLVGYSTFLIMSLMVILFFTI